MTTLTSPHDLMAAVPFLLGYQPLDSIVMITLKDDAVGMAMRIDFPEDIDPDQIDSFVSHLGRENAESVLLVAYVPDHVFDCMPLLTAISEALELRSISLRESLVIQAGRWRSMLCSDLECCPPEGSPIPEFKESRIAAEQVAQGRPLPFEGITSLIESIASQETPISILNELELLSPIDYKHSAQPLQREGAIAVSTFLAEFKLHGVVDEKLTALVLMRLHDLQVRDFALGIINSENIDSYWSAWRWLLTIAPKNFIAPVASIFAAISYERGDGVLAQRALDRAFADEKEYPLALLLRRVFTAGWPPEMFATMRAELHPKIAQTIFGENLGVA
jgi:hypothetical protein